VRAWLGAILFGGINVIQLRMQAAGTTIPAAFLHMLPFIFTIVILFVDQSDRSHPSLSQWGVP
jgi:simple sugar transport system permease protein